MGTQSLVYRESWFLLEYYAWPLWTLASLQSSTPLPSDICGELWHTDRTGDQIIHPQKIHTWIHHMQQGNQWWTSILGTIQRQAAPKSSENFIREFQTPCTMKNHWCFQSASNMKAKAISHALSLFSFLLQLHWEQLIIDVLNLAFSKFMQIIERTEAWCENFMTFKCLNILCISSKKHLRLRAIKL